MLGVECDLYRVEQGNKRHSDITTNQKTKHFSHNNSTEPKKCKGFEKARSHAECSTESSVTSYSDRVASKSFNACDNYANMSNMTCDCCIISDEGANKETSISCKCIVQLSAMDGLPSTQNSCCCGQAGTASRSGGHDDGKYTDNPSATDKMVEKIPQTCFVIKHLSMSVTSECVQKLDGLVMQFLTGRGKPTSSMNTYRLSPLFIKLQFYNNHPKYFTYNLLLLLFCPATIKCRMQL